jgi:hypothetical protein
LVSETEEDSDEVNYRIEGTRFRVYEYKAISIMYITASQTIQDSKVAVLFRRELNEQGQRRTQIFPLAQAMTLFEDVLARHVHAWKSL